MKKLYNLTAVVIFMLIIVAVPLLTKIEKPVEYSMFENRTLAAPPEFSFTALMSGEYLPKWEEYLSDHIWKRNAALKQFANINVNILKRISVNNVVVLEGLLLPFNEYPRYNYDFDGQAERVIEKLAELDALVRAYGGIFVYIGVPEQYSMLRDYYPEYLNNDSDRLTLIENTFFSKLTERGIEYINMRDEFTETGDFLQYYSKTDHHYNLYGAFYTYQTLINKINNSAGGMLPMLTENDTEFIALVNPFYGSRGRRLYDTHNIREQLYYYTVASSVPFVRYDNGTETDPVVFILPQDDIVPVTYNIYMGGDIAETIIKTNREYLPNALIFGDSFTNPLETFLYNSFNETVSLDLRHYDEKTLLEYVETYKPDYVFCLRDDTAYLSLDGNGDIG